MHPTRSANHCESLKKSNLSYRFSKDCDAAVRDIEGSLLEISSCNRERLSAISNNQFRGNFLRRNFLALHFLKKSRN